MDTPGQSGPQDLVGEATGRDLQLGRQGWGASPGWVGVVNSTTPGKGRPGQEGSGGLSDSSQLRQPAWLPEYRHQTSSSLASTPKRLTQALDTTVTWDSSNTTLQAVLRKKWGNPRGP